MLSPPLKVEAIMIVVEVEKRGVAGLPAKRSTIEVPLDPSEILSVRAEPGFGHRVARDLVCLGEFGSKLNPVN